MDRSQATVLALLVAVVAACAPGTGEIAHVRKEVGLFATENAAATAGSLNRPAPNQLARLPINSSVTVLSDTYGKDYWACHVRTEDGQTGWVLCTSLDYSGSSRGT